MSKTLVAFFSASGTTAKLAAKLAAAVGADLYEIKPEIPYTSADLDWTNKKSRSSLEMSDKAFRPAITNKMDSIEPYDKIFVAFPIWWYVAPTVVNTFLEQYNLSGMTIIPIATSGGSGMGNTNQELTKSCTGAVLKKGQVFSANTSEDDLKAWAQQYNK